MKIKENEKRDTYLDLARELKNLWKIKVAMMQIIIWTVPKGFVRELKKLQIGGWTKTNCNIAIHEYVKRT